MAAVRESGRDWVYAGAVVMVTGAHGERIVRAQRPLPPEQIGAALLRYDAVPGGGSNVVIRRTTWLQIGGFDTRLHACEDWELWIRLARHGLPVCVYEPLVARRLHSGNASLRISDFIRGTMQIEALHQTKADWASLYRWMAHSALRAGQPWTALALFGRATARGEIAGVASDLVSVVKHHYAWSRPEAQKPESEDPWIISARDWLRDLRANTRRADDPEGIATRVHQDSPS